MLKKEEKEKQKQALLAERKMRGLCPECGSSSKKVHKGEANSFGNWSTTTYCGECGKYLNQTSHSS
jgi:uncharacterized protein with PIN domain